MDPFEELEELFREFGIPGTDSEVSTSAAEERMTDARENEEEWSEEEEEETDRGETVMARKVDEFVTQFTSDDSDSDIEERESGEDSVTCTCKVSCYLQFDEHELQQHRLGMTEIQKTERDKYIMGCLKKYGKEETRGGKRKRTRYQFICGDKPVCRPAFMYIHNIGNKALRNIQKHLALNGPVPHVHGNTGRRPANAIKYEEARYCVDWIVWYADSTGLPMPAAPRGQGHEAPMFLPSCLTKKEMHTMYLQACHELGTRQLSVSSFKSIWSQCLPLIKIMTPKQDVCHKCELLRKKIADAVVEQEKLEASTSLTLHIQDAQAERKQYLSSITDARNEMSDHDRQPGLIPPLSSELRKVHYTFDYSKNVLIPNHSNQMGPLYFVSARKLQLFGVHIDSTDEQFNYIIDEDQSIDADGNGTHGPNSVISMVHHCLFRRSVGEKRCVLHADNCGSQNKNRFVTAYLLWRITPGLEHRDCFVNGNTWSYKSIPEYIPIEINHAQSMKEEYERRELQQKRHYFLFSELQNMARELPGKYQQRMPYDLLSGLANALLDGTVFQIVNGLKEVQEWEERTMFQQRSKLVSDHKAQKHELQKKHKQMLQDCQSKPHNLTLVKAQIDREMETTKKRCDEELRKKDQKIIMQLDQKVMDQQSTLEKAGVPGFYVTNKPMDIRVQMYLLGFITRLSQLDMPT